MKSTAHPTGTLATRGLHDIWLPCFFKESAAAARLKAMWLRRKDGAEREALFEGFWALQEAAKASAEHIRKRGGLLFAWHGSAAAQSGAA